MVLKSTYKVFQSLGHNFICASALNEHGLLDILDYLGLTALQESLATLGLGLSVRYQIR